MDRPRCRPFGLLDAMILIAALAVGLATMPPDSQYHRELLATSKITTSPWAWQVVRALHGSTSTWFALTAGFVAIRLRRPRAPLGRLRRQPGAVTCLAALVVGAISLGFNLGEYLHLGRGHRSLAEQHDQMFRFVPPAILGAWLSLALGGRWRPEPCWVDRLGSALAGGWVAGFLIRWVIF